MLVVVFDDTEVTLNEERWEHLVFLHSELKDKMRLVLSVVSGPDETYVDASAAVRILNRK